MYISKNKKEKFLSSAGKFLEPFGLGLLCLLFIIPALTFSNLTTLTKKVNDNVLGVQDEIGFNIELVGGNHNIFQNEHLYKGDDGQAYSYDTKIVSHTQGDYSKPILIVENLSNSTQVISLNGSTEIPIGSRIGIISENKFLELQDSLGDTSTVELTVAPSETTNVFLSVESFTNVQFGETFFMDITF